MNDEKLVQGGSHAPERTPSDNRVDAVPATDGTGDSSVLVSSLAEAVASSSLQTAPEAQDGKDMWLGKDNAQLRQLLGDYAEMDAKLRAELALRDETLKLLGSGKGKRTLARRIAELNQYMRTSHCCFERYEKLSQRAEELGILAEYNGECAVKAQSELQSAQKERDANYVIAKSWESALDAKVEELESAQQTILDLQGAMSAQDERERLAGERCQVLKEHSGCDWPDAVAEKVLEQEQTIRDLNKQLDEVKFQRAAAEVLAYGVFDLDGNQTMPSRADIESQLRDRDLTIQRLQEALEEVGNVVGRPTTHYASSKVQLGEQTDKLTRIFTLIAKALASDTQQTQAGDKQEGLR